MYVTVWLAQMCFEYYASIKYRDFSSTHNMCLGFVYINISGFIHTYTHIHIISMIIYLYIYIYIYSSQVYFNSVPFLCMSALTHGHICQKTWEKIFSWMICICKFPCSLLFSWSELSKMQLQSDFVQVLFNITLYHTQYSNAKGAL